MSSSQILLPSTSSTTPIREINRDHDQESEDIRDIHALTPSHHNYLPAPASRAHHRWETGSQRSYSMNSEGGSIENFTTMSREFNALVLAGSTVENNNDHEHNNNFNTSNDHHQVINVNNNINHNNNTSLLARIGEDGDYDDDVPHEETNPLAIVPDNNPLDPSPDPVGSRIVRSGGGGGGEVSVQRVKKEEVDAKIIAWQNAKISKINNRFKREDAIINGRESEQVQKYNSWMKKVERKLEEKRVKALEKMQNKVAKAHRKAEDRRASAEAKRGTKIAQVLELANLMRAVGRPPAKRSFF